ncbi:MULTISPECIES: hypothetical protein [Streptomycetaceae]|uniref:hypothetical protein n=1 Tax=Streptomycetaceae TaxID=2062 RepID=UPI00093EBE03|nr:hypothetical protein [Streptomyces sp. CB02056]OKI06898.1 hypothetical protein AMK13_15930 [Streptomyces sp. CB02056]
MYEQPPPQVPPIDRTVGYDPYLSVYRRTVDVGGGLHSTMSATHVIVGFTGHSTPTGAVADTDEAGADPTGTAIILIMDGPGGLYGPSFADPAPWVCGGAPTPGCVPPPPPVIGGLY